MRKLLGLALAVLFVVALWVGCLVLALGGYRLNPSDKIGAYGQIGDTFGSVNALFTGLGLIGIVYTILLQREENKDNRLGLSRQSKEQYLTARLTATTALLQANDVKATTAALLRAEIDGRATTAVLGCAEIDGRAISDALFRDDSLTGSGTNLDVNAQIEHLIKEVFGTSVHGYAIAAADMESRRLRQGLSILLCEANQGFESHAWSPKPIDRHVLMFMIHLFLEYKNRYIWTKILARPPLTSHAHNINEFMAEVMILFNYLDQTSRSIKQMTRDIFMNVAQCRIKEDDPVDPTILRQFLDKCAEEIQTYIGDIDTGKMLIDDVKLQSRPVIPPSDTTGAEEAHGKSEESSVVT